MDVHNEKTLWGKGNMRSRGGGMPSPIPPEVCALPDGYGFDTTACLLAYCVAISGFPRIEQKSSQNPPCCSWKCS